jgi:4-aminobutyrate aminotransferase/(S)-3-amino-2-methylpropionate transaminase
MIIEPYQGSAGFLFPPDGFLPLVEQWARNKGILFTVDEVQSAYGRTGWQWASDREGLKPDIITVGKGIGCGVPVAALLLKKDLVKDLGRGDLGSTYGGNPVSCAAVSAVLKIMKEEEIITNVRRIEKIFMERFRRIEERSKFAGEIRGRGLVYGIELVNDKTTREPSSEKTRQLIDICAQNGLLVGGVGLYGNVIRVAPPLVINEEQANESLDIMESCLSKLT